MMYDKQIWRTAIAGIAILQAGFAFAQEAPGAASAKVTGQQSLSGLTKPLAAQSVDQKTIGEIAATLSKQSGILILADSTIQSSPVSYRVGAMPVTETLKGISRLVPGCNVRLIAVAKEDRSPNADLIVQLLRLQDTIQSVKPQKSDKKSADKEAFSVIEIAGRRVDIAKAEPILTALDLQPAFVLTSMNTDDAVGKLARIQAESLQAYLAMTPEQRAQAAEQQINNLLNMDSAARRALFGQMQDQAMAVMKKLNSLSPDQRAQFYRDITGGKFDGTVPPSAQDKPGVGNGQP